MQYLNSMIRLRILEKVTFQKILEEGKRIGPVGIWEKSSEGKGKSQYKAL